MRQVPCEFKRLAIIIFRCAPAPHASEFGRAAIERVGVVELSLCKPWCVLLPIEKDRAVTRGADQPVV